MAGLVHENGRRDIIILVLLSSLIGAVSSESTGTETCATKYRDCFCEDSHCFFLVEKNITFSAAEQYCRGQGGHLATVRSANVQRRLHGIAGERRVWIGPLRIYCGFNQFDTSNSESTAVMLSRSRRQWTWKSSSKFGERGFICETAKLGETCTTSNDDNVVVYELDGRCILYSLGKQYYSWYHARQTCNSFNADLIKMPTEEIQTKLWSVFGVLAPDERWIGLRNNVWRWGSCGQELKEWHWSDRVVGGGSRHCVILDNRLPEFRSWEPASCTEAHNFVCEIRGEVQKKEEKEKHSKSAGTIAGACVGGFACIIALSIGIIIFVRRRKQKTRQETRDGESQDARYSDLYTTPINFQSNSSAPEEPPQYTRLFVLSSSESPSNEPEYVNIVENDSYG